MPRWSKSLGNSVNFAVEKVEKDNFLKNFFERRTFVPESEEEINEFEDFSFITSAIALLVYLAKSDGEFTQPEKKRILDELIFQLEQYPHEYAVLSERFGTSDREIVEKLIRVFEQEIDDNRFHIDEQLETINLIYQNNPYKRFFLVRLCYYLLFSEKESIKQEKFDLVKGISLSLDVEEKERLRILDEVKKEIGRGD